MIQIILTLGLTLIFVYSILQRHRIRIIASAIAAAALFGIVMVRFPDAVTTLANGIGVGRGADLIFYLWVLVGAAVMVIMHVQMKVQEQKITLLARELAIERALRKVVSAST
jgi:hypothetical protein